MQAGNTVLVIDDDRFMYNIISDILQQEGFSVFGAHDLESTMEQITLNRPDLILLDVVLPKMNGFKLCRLLRNDSRTSHIPIIMITSRDGVQDKVAGLEAGADDYVTKPFDNIELVARLKTCLRRAKKEKSFNPLTSLPGNIMIEEEIKRRVAAQDRKFAVLYLDLDNFKAYNDVYGFLKGDEVLKFMASILLNNVKDNGNPDDFVGHIGGDDFIVITSPDKDEVLCKKIVDQFDSTISLFYNSVDRKHSYIVTKDRNNNEIQYPLMTISIAIVTNEIRNIDSHWIVSEIAAELKKYAKGQVGSTCVKDRRGNTQTVGD